MLNIDNISSGYFGSLAKPNSSTKTHLYDKVSKKVLCGYKPAKSMIYQWCNPNALSTLNLECVNCLEKQKKMKDEYSLN